MAYINSVADLMGVPSTNVVQPSDKKLPDSLKKTEKHCSHPRSLPRTNLTHEVSIKQGFVQLNILPKHVVKENLSDKKFNMYLKCLRFNELPNPIVSEASNIKLRKNFMHSLSSKDKEKRTFFKYVNGWRKELNLRENASKKCFIKYFPPRNQQYKTDLMVRVTLSKITKSSEEGYTHKCGNDYLKKISELTFKVLNKCETSSVPVKETAICPFMSHSSKNTSVVEKSPSKANETKEKIFHENAIHKNTRRNGMRSSRLKIKKQALCRFVNESLQNISVVEMKTKEKPSQKDAIKKIGRKNGLWSSHSMYSNFDMQHDSVNLKVILEEIKKSSKGNGWSHISGSSRFLQTGENTFKIITLEDVNSVVGTNKCYITELSPDNNENSQSTELKGNQCSTLCKENYSQLPCKSPSKNMSTDEDNQCNPTKNLKQSNSNPNCESLEINSSNSTNNVDTLLNNKFLSFQPQKREKTDDIQEIEDINSKCEIIDCSKSDQNSDSDSSHSSSKPSESNEWVVVDDVDEVSNDGVTNMETNILVMTSENMKVLANDCDKSTNNVSEIKFDNIATIETGKNIKELLNNCITTNKISDLSNASEHSKSSSKKLSKTKRNILRNLILKKYIRFRESRKNKIPAVHEANMNLKRTVKRLSYLKKRRCKKKRTLLMQLREGLLKKYYRWRTIKKKRMVTPIHKTGGISSVHEIIGISPVHETNGNLPVYETGGISLVHEVGGISPVHKADEISLIHETDVVSAVHVTDVISSHHETAVNLQPTLKSKSENEEELQYSYEPSVSPVSSESSLMSSEMGLQKSRASTPLLHRAATPLLPRVATPISPISSSSPDKSPCPESFVTKPEFLMLSKGKRASSIKSSSSSCMNDSCIDIISTESNDSRSNDFESDKEIECINWKDNNVDVAAAVNLWGEDCLCDSLSLAEASVPLSKKVKFADCVYKCRKSCVHERLVLCKNIGSLSRSTFTNGNSHDEVKHSSIKTHSETLRCKKDVTFSSTQSDKIKNSICFNSSLVSESDSDLNLNDSSYFSPLSLTKLYGVMQNCYRPSNNTQQLNGSLHEMFMEG